MCVTGDMEGENRAEAIFKKMIDKNFLKLMKFKSDSRSLLNSITMKTKRHIIGKLLSNC